MATFKVGATFNGEELVVAVKDMAKQLRFANVVALTRVAVLVKEAEYDEFRMKFDSPTDYTMDSLEVRPAKMNRPEAEVATKGASGSTPAGAYLNPEVDGGRRRMKSTEKKIGGFIVPSKFQKLDQYGNVPGGVWRKMLSNIQAGGQDNVTDSKASKGKRRKLGYFLRNGIIYERSRQYVPRTRGRRKGNSKASQSLYAIIPAFILVKNEPDYSPRIDWYGVAQRVFKEKYSSEFDKAYAMALSTAS